MKNELKLISMDTVETENVQWLWYPYIPLGKINIVQGAPGEDVDMHRANEVRPVLKRVAAMAKRTHCAVLLVGHMNKAQGQKSSYRGLGSIDFRAAARSVLVVGRLKDNERIRIVAQDKNSLAPEGSSIAFELNEQTGFCWKGACEATVDDVLNGTGKVQTKTTLMEEELKAIGNNLNQLVTLAHMGRITVINLGEVRQLLADIRITVREIAERKRW